MLFKPMLGEVWDGLLDTCSALKWGVSGGAMLDGVGGALEVRTGSAIN